MARFECYSIRFCSALCGGGGLKCLATASLRIDYHDQYTGSMDRLGFALKVGVVRLPTIGSLAFHSRSRSP